MVKQMARLFPNMRIVFQQENPKRAGSKVHARYEIYKRARTVLQATDLGATSGELAWDKKAGYLRVVSENGDSEPGDEGPAAAPPALQRHQKQAAKAPIEAAAAGSAKCEKSPKRPVGRPPRELVVSEDGTISPSPPRPLGARGSTSSSAAKPKRPVGRPRKNFPDSDPDLVGMTLPRRIFPSRGAPHQRNIPLVDAIRSRRRSSLPPKGFARRSRGALVKCILEHMTVRPR